MQDIIVLHGGAGSSERFNQVLQKYANDSIDENDALSAVVRAVSLMEDDEQFNAGTGSVTRIDGSIQMDAAVMTEESLGAVINIERVKNPVMVARSVMENTPHVILSGDGATEFARVMGFEDYNPSTEKSVARREILLKKLFSSGSEQDPALKPFISMKGIRELARYTTDTVGAVCRMNGAFAAAVSTGGAFPMLRGRVGDSPIPGSGIYVGKKGAIVATGIGEEIIKKSLSFKVYSEIGAADLLEILEKAVADFSSSVGLIAVDEHGHASASNREMATAVARK